MHELLHHHPMRRVDPPKPVEVERGDRSTQSAQLGSSAGAAWSPSAPRNWCPAMTAGDARECWWHRRFVGPQAAREIVGYAAATSDGAVFLRAALTVAEAACAPQAPDHTSLSHQARQSLEDTASQVTTVALVLRCPPAYEAR